MIDRIAKPVFIALLFLTASVLPQSLSVQAAEPNRFTVSDFSFTSPDSWKSIRPRSSMRKAQLSVPNSKDGDAGEVVFFHFGPGSAGGTKANIDRWYRQFQEPVAKLNAGTEEARIGDIKVSFVHAEGTFMSGPPVGRKVAKANYALLGAIVEAKKGSIFVKFTGPSTLVKSAEADFKTMVTSAKPL